MTFKESKGHLEAGLDRPWFHFFSQVEKLLVEMCQAQLCPDLPLLVAHAECQVTHEIKRTDEQPKQSERCQSTEEDVSKAPSCGLYWNVFMFFFSGGDCDMCACVFVCAAKLNSRSSVSSV